MSESFVARVQTLLDRHVPANVRHTGDAEALVLYWSLVPLMAAVALVSEACHYALNGQFATAHSVVLMVPISIGSVVWFRLGGAFRPYMHLSLGAMVASSWWLMLATGGPVSPSVAHLFLVVAAAGAFVGLRSMWVWTAVCAAGLAGMLWVPPEWVLFAESTVDHSLREDPLTIGVATAAAAVWLVTLVFHLDHARSRETVRLRANVAEVAAANEEAARINEDLCVAREATESARRLAEEASQARSAFLATMSHEIRTPLNGTLGTLQLLDVASLSPEALSLVEVARRSGDSLLTLVNDILDLSKFEAGDVQLENVAVSVRDLCEEVATRVSELAQETRVSVTVAVDPTAPAAVLTDPTRLRQVLHHVVSNAVKFSPGGQVVLETMYTGDGLQCEVRDTGIGMSADVLERLFQPFMQADSSTTRRFGGTGLGLAISKLLVDAMGGDLQVQSTQGIGTVVQVFVPASATEPVSKEAWTEVSSQETFYADGLVVLLAEDNPINVLVAERMLSGLGCEVVVARNGQEAVDCAAKGGLDLVLMDIQMPVMDGLDAAAAIRAAESLEGQRVPIVALSAEIGPAERRRARDAGMDDYLDKPIERAALMRVLGRARRLAGEAVGGSA